MCVMFRTPWTSVKETYDNTLVIQVKLRYTFFSSRKICKRVKMSPIVIIASRKVASIISQAYHGSRRKEKPLDMVCDKKEIWLWRHKIITTTATTRKECWHLNGLFLNVAQYTHPEYLRSFLKAFTLLANAISICSTSLLTLMIYRSSRIFWFANLISIC